MFWIEEQQVPFAVLADQWIAFDDDNSLGIKVRTSLGVLSITPLFVHLPPTVHYVTRFTYCQLSLVKFIQSNLPRKSCDNTLIISGLRKKRRGCKLQFSDKLLQISDGGDYGCSEVQLCPPKFQQSVGFSAPSLVFSEHNFWTKRNFPTG